MYFQLSVCIKVLCIILLGKPPEIEIACYWRVSEDGSEALGVGGGVMCRQCDWNIIFTVLQASAKSVKLPRVKKAVLV